MKVHPLTRIAVVVVAALAIVSCSSSGGDKGESSAGSTDTSSSVDSSSTTSAVTGECPTVDEMTFLGEVTSEQDDGPLDQNDIDNVIERGRILRPYVPVEMIGAFDLYIEDFVAAYRKLEGVDVPALITSERAQDLTYTPPGMTELRAIVAMANDPKYGAVVAFMGQQCPGVIF